MMLRYSYLLNATQYAQGDFARTASSYANQVRLLKLSVQELGTAMGQGIIAAIQPALVALNTLMNYLIAAARAFRTFMYTIFGAPAKFGKGLVNEFAEMTDMGDDLANSVGGGGGTGGGGVAGGLDKAAKGAKALKKQLTVLPFDELNQLAKDMDSAGGAGSPSGGGGGGGGAGGGGLGDFGLDTGLVDLDEILKGNKAAEAISRWGEMIKKAFKKHDWAGLGRAMAWGINLGIGQLYKVLDPEKVKKNVFPFIDAFTTTMNSFIYSVNFHQLGQALGRGINDIVLIADRFITGIEFDKIGKKFSQFLNGMVSEIDWGGLGAYLAHRFMALVNFLHGAITTFDWKGLGTSLGNGVNGIVDNVDWALFADTVGQALVGALNGLAAFISTVDWKAVGDSVKEFLVGLPWDDISSAFFEALGTALGGIVEFLIGLLEDGFNSAVEGVNSAIEECGGNVIAGLLAGMAEGMMNIVSWLGENVFTPIVDGIMSVFDEGSPAKAMKPYGGWITEGLLVGMEDESNNSGTYITNVKNGIVGNFADARTWLEPTGGQLATGIRTGWEAKKQDVLMSMGGLGGNIQSRIGNLEKTGKNIASDFDSGFGKIKDNTSDTLTAAAKEIKLNVELMGTEGHATASAFTTAFNAGMSSRTLANTINNAFRSIFATLNTNKNTLHTKGKEAGAAYTKGFGAGFNEKTMTGEATSGLTAILNTLNGQIGSFRSAGASLGNAFGSSFNAYARAAVKTPKLVQNGDYYDAKTKTHIPMYRVEWNAEGGLFTKATVLNGFGEAGDEAAIPLTNRRAMKRIANAIIDGADGFGLDPRMLAEAVEYGVSNAMSSGNTENQVFYIEVKTQNDEVLARAVQRGNAKLNRRYTPSAAMA